MYLRQTYARLGKTGYRHIVSVLSQLDQTAAEVLPRVHLIFSLLKVPTRDR
jgi:hypothetical protein